VKCLVCHATWPDPQQSTCPQCGNDTAAKGANEASHVHAAREAFKQKTTAYAPNTRVTQLDKWKPWLALALALLLFTFWLRSCLG
jgi:hypothetical protein